MSRTRKLLAGAALAPLAWGCAQIIGADFDSPRLGPKAPADAAPSDATMGPDVAVDRCPSVRPPAQPAQATAGGDVDLTMAIASVKYGEDGSFRTIGYDLDKVCPGEAPECLFGPGAIRDAAGGRDNTTGGLLQQLKLAFTAGNVSYGSDYDSQGLRDGRYGILLRVRGYNGEPDDREVSLEWYTAAPFDRDKAPGTKPAWDGNDQWPLEATGVTAGDGGAVTRYVDDKAYVAGGVLVGAPFELPLKGATVEIRLSQLFITGTLKKSGAGYEIQDGTLAGRWKTTDALAALPLIKAFDASFCTTSPGYNVVKGQICSAVDLSSTGVAPTRACDAISVGLAFTALPAKAAPLGRVVDGGYPVNGCAPANDPARDTCPGAGGGDAGRD